VTEPIKGFDPFGDMNKNRSPEHMRAMDESRWEEAVVKHTLQRLGIDANVRRKMAEIWHREKGIFALKFSVFNDMFSTFPYLFGTTRLDGKHVHQDPKATEPSRFKKFAQVSFVEAYREFYQDVYNEADLRKVGMIFPRKGFKYGMVIHNDDTETFWSSGLCWVYKAKQGDRLYVQPFSSLLENIKASHIWRPEI
jgi:hypothetical protein